jgi:hypothetical protein
MKIQLGGWGMIRSIFLLAVAAGLAGCASMDTADSSGTARVQTAVYRVSDNATSATQAGSLRPVIKSVDAASDPMAPSESPPVRIYWFLGGR